MEVNDLRYLMVYPYNQFTEIIFRDLALLPNVEEYSLKAPLSNKLLHNLRRVHTSPKLRKLFPMPFQDIWVRSLFKRAKEADCVIFWVTALTEVSLDFLHKMKKRHVGQKMVLLIWDSLHGTSPLIPAVWHKIFDFPWDYIISFDKEDCQEFGFDWLGQSYYSKMEELKPVGPASDIYYVGNERGRTQQILAIYRKLSEAGIKCNFNLCKDAGLKKRIQLAISKDSGMEYEKGGLNIGYLDQPYQQVLQELLNSGCILEVLQTGQHTQTVRYFEAVCYNKKLLTNNKNIVDLPFYDERYMRVFEKAEDIDVDWIRLKDEVDYGYRGEFSPARIVDMIEEYFGKEEEDC